MRQKFLAILGPLKIKNLLVTDRCYPETVNPYVG